MSRVKVKLDIKAFGELRNSAGVVAHLRSRAGRASAVTGGEVTSSRSPGALTRTWFRVTADDYDTAIQAREAMR